LANYFGRHSMRRIGVGSQPIRDFRRGIDVM
jgi:hypothetical protein